MGPAKPAMVAEGGMSSCKGLVEIDGSGTRPGGGKLEGFDAQDTWGRSESRGTFSELVHSVGMEGEGERKVIVGRSRPGSWRKIYLRRVNLGSKVFMVEGARDSRTFGAVGVEELGVRPWILRLGHWCWQAERENCGWMEWVLKACAYPWGADVYE